MPWPRTLPRWATSPCCWAGPLLAGQFALAGLLWSRRRLLAVDVAAPTGYLWGVDWIGLHLPPCWRSTRRLRRPFFYPHLLKLGTGAGGKGSAASEVRDGIKDHNEIRDAAADVDRQDVGSDVWWQAVIKARAVNSDHTAEEDLADFRRHRSDATGGKTVWFRLPLVICLELA